MRASGRLATLAALPSAERRHALRALFTLIEARLGLALFSLHRVRRLVERSGRAVTPSGDPEAAARAVRRAVDRAARTLPASSCLAQALAAEAMLRRAGCAVRLHIGVAADGQPLDAHAWTESAGVIVTGDAAELARYQSLLVFRHEPAAPHDG